MGPIKVDRSPAAIAAAAAAASAAGPESNSDAHSDEHLVAGDSTRNGSANKKPLSINVDVDALRAETAQVNNIHQPDALDHSHQNMPGVFQEATQRSPSGSSSGSLTPTGFHRIHTRSGVKSQQVCSRSILPAIQLVTPWSHAHTQDSNFKLTGQQIDDDKIGRTSVKLHQPPGGKSSGLW